MYQSEFPVEQPVPVFDPTLLVGLALAALLIAALAFVAGRLVGRRERQGVDTDAPKTIHEAIKKKCVAASSAPSGELVRKTQELITEIEALIGPLLTFGGPCAKVLASLKKAMEPKAPPEEKPHKPEGEAHAHPHSHPHAPQSDTKAHGEGEGHAHGHPGHGSGCRCESCLVIAIGQAAPGLSIVGPRVGAQTVVITPPPAPPHPPEPPKPPPVEPKVLGHKDYIDQVRLAVIEVSDFWSRGECLAELQDCQRALNTAAPAAFEHAGRRSGERVEHRLHNRQAKPDVSV